MRIEKFFVVTQPRLKSKLEDCLFSATIQELQLQFKGGLDASEVHSIWDNYPEAEVQAQKLLKERNNVNA